MRKIQTTIKLRIGEKDLTQSWEKITDITTTAQNILGFKLRDRKRMRFCC